MKILLGIVAVYVVGVFLNMARMNAPSAGSSESGLGCGMAVFALAWPAFYVWLAWKWFCVRVLGREDDD